MTRRGWTEGVLSRRAYVDRGYAMKPMVAASTLLLALGACGGGESGPLTTLADSASYAVGMNMGASLEQAREDIVVEQVVQGLRDRAGGQGTRLSEQQARQVVQTFVAQLEQKQSRTRSAQADSNRLAGDAYRAVNAKRPGVQATASGIQYEVLAQGSGPRPSATDRVQVHYRGTRVDGKEFDSSYRSGQPATFALNAVIPGWAEAIQLMPVGSKYRIVLPPELAYGPSGAGPDVGPNATLIFEVELIGIQK
jgi:FKBP-type peptidyl-prolyl cis-trans isomerase